MRELWVSKDTGEISTAKLWRNIAYLVGTYLVIRLGDKITAEILLVYLAVVSGSELASRVITAKYRGAVNDSFPTGRAGYGGGFHRGRWDGMDSDEYLLQGREGCSGGEAVIREGRGREESRRDFDQVRGKARQAARGESNDK